MTEEYLGILGAHDPLYEVLASRVLPGVTNPVFHVSRMSSRNTVYKYTEEKTGKRLVGKFFNTRQNDTYSREISGAGEYDNLKVIRSYGFDTSPHLVVRPISREEKIGLALIEEFIDGYDLDHYFKQAVCHKDSGSLEARLSRLASFLYTLHRNTELAGFVDLKIQSDYFRRILDALCQDTIIPQSDRCRYVAMRDKWLNNRAMRVSRRIVHGDPTPTNFIFTHDGDIVAIDLERMKEADAVFDLGMVCAETKHAFFWRTGNRYASEPYITYFFSRYAFHFPDSTAAFQEITQRNPFYMALAELRIARNHYLDTEYRKKLAFEALQCLEHGLCLL